MHRVGSTRDERLDCSDQETGHHHGVHRLVRAGTVSALPADVDREAVGVRRNRAGRHHDFAEPIVMGDVAGEDRLDRVQRVCLHDRARSVSAFFSWLKNEQDSTLWRLSLE